MSEATKEPSKAPSKANVEDAEPSASDVWKSLSSVADKTERLAQLLEKVGPDAYNEFIHSDEYLGAV